MDHKLKAKWIRALRGKKYRQAQGALKVQGGFCCLGVIAAIQGAVWVNGYPIINGDDSQNNSCYLLPRFAGGLRKKTQLTLTNMNDSGIGFKKIADYIEKRIA